PACDWAVAPPPPRVCPVACPPAPPPVPPGGDAAGCDEDGGGEAKPQSGSQPHLGGVLAQRQEGARRAGEGGAGEAGRDVQAQRLRAVASQAAAEPRTLSVAHRHPRPAIQPAQHPWPKRQGTRLWLPAAGGGVATVA
ncbi:hypothetical protein EC988_010278, partial [Linderina pennispora]